MSEIAERYRKVAGQFTDRARSVPAAAWDNPAPCAGWVAHDVVRHMVEWMPGFLHSFMAIEVLPGPSVDDDPVGAWVALSDAIQALLDDPAIAAREFDLPMGRTSFEEGIATFFMGDVLVHTWDLARATGLDETLDADEVHQLLVGMAPAGEAMRGSGHYGPRVEVPDDADEQTQLIAFSGRHP